MVLRTRVPRDTLNLKGPSRSSSTLGTGTERRGSTVTKPGNGRFLTGGRGPRRCRNDLRGGRLCLHERAVRIRGHFRRCARGHRRGPGRSLRKPFRRPVGQHHRQHDYRHPRDHQGGEQYQRAPRLLQKPLFHVIPPSQRPPAPGTEIAAITEARGNFRCVDGDRRLRRRFSRSQRRKVFIEPVIDPRRPGSGPPMNLVAQDRLTDFAHANESGAEARGTRRLVVNDLRLVDVHLRAAGQRNLHRESRSNPYGSVRVNEETAHRKVGRPTPVTAWAHRARPPGRVGSAGLEFRLVGLGRAPLARRAERAPTNPLRVAPGANDIVRPPNTPRMSLSKNSTAVTHRPAIPILTQCDSGAKSVNFISKAYARRPELSS